MSFFLLRQIVFHYSVATSVANPSTSTNAVYGSVIMNINGTDDTNQTSPVAASFSYRFLLLN